MKPVNDHLGDATQNQLETPFHYSKQQSISDIAPETQRSQGLRETMLLRSSLENIYGFMMDEGAAGEDGLFTQ
jgi:hypothetical protein